MQLRIHPKMKWEGFSNWPPVWATSPMGEEGVLTSVEMNEAGNTLPRHLVLTMMHLGRGSSAMLCCDDEEKVIPDQFRHPEQWTADTCERCFSQPKLKGFSESVSKASEDT